MSTYLKQLQSYVKNVKEHTLNKPSYLGESRPFLPEQVSQDLFPSQSLNVLPADMSTENLSQRNFNLLTDTYSGTHDYE